MLAIKEMQIRTSSQDGGIGKHTVTLRTTKRRTTNLKTKKQPELPKIELYGSLTTKELKKKQLTRPVGGAETGSWGKEAWQQLVDPVRWWLEERVVPHLHVDKPEGTTGE